MDPRNENDVKTRLMTLLNVSQLRSTKRKLGNAAPSNEMEVGSTPADKRIKLNRKRAVIMSEPEAVDNKDATEDENVTLENEVEDEADEKDDEDVEEEEQDVSDKALDPSVLHFGPNSQHLTAERRAAAEAGLWKKEPKKLWAVPSSNKGQTTVNGLRHELDVPTSLEQGVTDSKKVLAPKLVPVLERIQSKQTAAIKAQHQSVLETLSSTSDLQLSNVKFNEQSTIRDAISLHLLNHILKIRNTVLKNNDRIASCTSKTPPLPIPEDIQDQGFTRPSTLILLPFRNSALSFLSSFLAHYTALSGAKKSNTESQIHHHARFVTQYSLPEGSIDKLAEAEEGVYPADHVATFKGNIDDNFRIGVKVTKRSVRLFETFYGADLIVASPLGLRLACEKEGNADFLSSIEVVVVDQMDAMTMQNWDHVLYVFSQLNKIPKDSHGADFSRIKPWFLDGHGAYLRQTILLSQYETPETRALFNSLKNVAGKTRTTVAWEPAVVPEGVEQKFIKFEASNAREEVDRRFEWFTTKLFPATLKSAVQSSGAVIFIPSYFDFVRVQNWLMSNGTSCAFISEYSTNQEISRARQAFFSGDKSFLVITERFQFFRRYRLRGIRNIIFYAPPDHPQFYTELLSYPFLDTEVQASDVSVKVLYSKYDVMRLERIVGSRAVGPLVRD